MDFRTGFVNDLSGTEDAIVLQDLYGPSEQLRHLQLQCARSIAERQSAPSDQVMTLASDAFLSSQLPEKWAFLPSGCELYPWQRAALGRWLEHRRGTIKVATGGGKTRFALAVAERMQNDVAADLVLVVVVPTIPLMNQWLDELTQGNIPADAIGRMGGGHSMELGKGTRIAVCVLASARRKLPELVRAAGVADRLLLIVDECHRAAAAESKAIFDCGAAYALGLSATPEAGDAADPASSATYDESELGRALGPIIYDLTVAEALAAGLLTPFEVYHIGLPLSAEEKSRHNRLSDEIRELRPRLEKSYRKSRSKQSFLPWCQTQVSRSTGLADDSARLLTLGDERKRLLYGAIARQEVALGILADAAVDSESRSILFHEKIDEVDALFAQAWRMGLPVVLEHSQLPQALRDENIEAFRRGIARQIVSAKSLIEGFNVPSADVGIIAASSGSIRQRIQSLGRMLRRKGGERVARIYVLYVREPEDERIYESADWEQIIGAERNRYFHWAPTTNGHWAAGLVEQEEPPRSYLPPSKEVDTASLRRGDAYPGRPDGMDLSIDQDRNLRNADRRRIPVSAETAEYILTLNKYRKAHLTNAGHLITRSNEGWVFVGDVVDADATVEDNHASPSIELTLSQNRGQRVIARPHRGGRVFARRDEQCDDPSAAGTVEQLLEWITRHESKIGRPVRSLYWDGATRYWIEIDGRTFCYPDPIGRLEFPPERG